MIPLLTPKNQQIFQKQLRNAAWFRNEKNRLARLALEKRRRKLKRQIGTCSLSQTPLGHLLIHECPEEWGRLCSLISCERKAHIAADLIHSIFLNSNNPIIHTVEYHEAMIDFRQYGFQTPNAIPFNANMELLRIYEKYENEEIETNLLLI